MFHLCQVSINSHVYTFHSSELNVCCHLNVDEEMGGTLGMRAFVQTEDFRNLHVGFALDEGIASPVEEMPVFYAERSVWRK